MKIVTKGVFVTIEDGVKFPKDYALRNGVVPEAEFDRFKVKNLATVITRDGFEFEMRLTDEQRQKITAHSGWTRRPFAITLEIEE